MAQRASKGVEIVFDGKPVLRRGAPALRGVRRLPGKAAEHLDGAGKITRFQRGLRGRDDAGNAFRCAAALNIDKAEEGAPLAGGVADRAGREAGGKIGARRHAATRQRLQGGQRLPARPDPGERLALGLEGLAGCGSLRKRGKGEGARSRMMVSAYAARLRLTLATVPADRGAELEAAIEALGLIALRGKVVTGDALHCNRRTVEVINARGGDWCLALKGNQESLLSDARGCFGGTIDPRHQATTEEAGHGRKETRKATVVSAKSLEEYHEFPGLKAFGRIEATREVNGKTSSETRWFAMSWRPEPDVLLATVRDHWAIENALHWQLDVSFREDAARNRKDNAPGNIAVLRRRALDVVRQDKSKCSLSIKLKRAGWDEDFLRSILSSMAEA